MGPIDFFLHTLNFLAPALFLAAVLALAGRWRRHAGAWVRSAWLQFAINVAAGGAVLAGGLVHFGRDGKMATYAALVLVVASVQWLCAAPWRR